MSGTEKKGVHTGARDSMPATGDEDPSSLLEDVVLSPVHESVATGPVPVGAVLVGEVQDCEHPTLTGRAQVVVAGSKQATWVPVLRGLVVRSGDRVLLARPDNMIEAVVIGVLDGFSRRNDAPRTSAANIILQSEEVVTISTADGTRLVELAGSATGPVVRILQPDLDVELSGRVRVKAASLELIATRGEVKIEAADDVVVKGENVHLN